MRRLLPIFILCLLAVTLAVNAFGADRATITQRVRAELATILKKDPAKLPVEKPVKDFGADDLDIVEWVMAVEEAFKIYIPDEKISDAKSKDVRKDLSITHLTGLVLEALKEKPKEKQR